MTAPRLLAWLSDTLRPARPKATLGLLPAEEFRAELERARALTDRSGHPFSLALFELRSPDINRSVVQGIARCINERNRATDRAGWYRPRELGILLPHTRPAGAWRVAEDICQQAPAECDLGVHVYAYTNGDVEPPSPASGTLPGSDRTDARNAGNGASLTRTEPGTAAHDLERLLVRRVPAWKRGFDIVGALLGLILVSPIMIVAAIAIKTSSRGPIIFGQQRAGRGDQPFTFYKFRTMIDGADELKRELLSRNEQTGPVFKIRYDPRITPVGRLMRKLSIDELPQLLNVLRGDMSLIGPRPLPCDESRACTGWARRRLEVTPGLSCIWQVSGRCEIGFQEWMRMDLRYVNNVSPLLDLKILLRTLPAVLSGRGAH